MMSERIIISLTTWSSRIDNLPAVLDTILEQSVKPDHIVINLSFYELVPDHVQAFINKHYIEVFRVSDTKVYKKLIPTLKRFPDDVIITIDDDWLYPKGMIEDFVSVHKKYPHNPISGNREVFNGLQCHCGCASLTKKEYFGDYLDAINEELMLNCPSSDLVYTYLALLSGHTYVRTKGLYYLNMVPYNGGKSYSKEAVGNLGMERTYQFLVEKFGKKQWSFSSYLEDKHMSELLDDLYSQKISLVKYETEMSVRSSISYRLGHVLLKPFLWIKK